MQGVCVLIAHGGVDVFPIRFAGKPKVGGAAHDAKAKAGVAQNSDLEFLIAADFEHNITQDAAEHPAEQADPAIADQIEKDAADDTCDGQHTKLLNLGIVEHHRNAADDRPNYEQERVDHRQRSKQADNKENNEGHGCVNADID